MTKLLAGGNPQIAKGEGDAKVAFFRGTSLRPVPPGASAHKEVRYLDIRENDRFDEGQMETWIRQAAAVPGWEPSGR